MYKNGKLGGEIMPEDKNPNFEKSSSENYLYFTLPMALNYQRNSYALWESANKTYEDESTRFVFEPKECLNHSFEEVQFALTKYYDGDIRKLFTDMDNDVDKIRKFIQIKSKKLFPYLSGTKI